MTKPTTQTPEHMRYCPLCACQKPRQNGWFLQRVDGIKTWVCPVHKDVLGEV